MDKVYLNQSQQVIIAHLHWCFVLWVLFVCLLVVFFLFCFIHNDIFFPNFSERILIVNNVVNEHFNIHCIHFAKGTFYNYKTLLSWSQNDQNHTAAFHS
jgi:hypothetical protein